MTGGEQTYGRKEGKIGGKVKGKGGEKREKNGKVLSLLLKLCHLAQYHLCYHSQYHRCQPILVSITDTRIQGTQHCCYVNHNSPTKFHQHPSRNFTDFQLTVQNLGYLDAASRNLMQILKVNHFVPIPKIWTLKTSSRSIHNLSQTHIQI